jgi:DNA modification methylase
MSVGRWDSDDGTVTLYRGDALQVMRGLTGVGAVVTDPPYGIGESGKKNATREKLAKPRDYGDYRWDDKLDRAYIDAILSMAPHVVLFGGNYYADWLPASSSWIVWDKDNSGDFADCELAWTSHDKAVRKFTWRWNGFIRQQPEARFHPTQKPLALMRWIVEHYTPKCVTVLDPFMGSGTTGVACVESGRRFIGIDDDPYSFAIAKRRIIEALAQPRLPLAEPEAQPAPETMALFEVQA